MLTRASAAGIVDPVALVAGCLVFALVLRAVRDGGNTQDAVAHALIFLPVWILVGGVICAISFARQGRILSARIKSSP